MIQKQNESEFIGIVMSVVREPSRLEGIDQEQYTLEIHSFDKGYFSEWVSISPSEVEGVLEENSILSLYAREIHYVLPETKEMVDHKYIFNALINKEFRWTQKQMGKKILDFPIKKYLVPRHVNQN